jgi:general secretion pathway protein D
MKQLFCMLLIASVILSFSAGAQTPPVSTSAVTSSGTAGAEKVPEGPRIWNFENADIKTVINAVSRETGKNFIVDPRVQGKVTLISNTPLEKDELYQVFLTLLQTYGFLVIPDGANMFKIVPDSVAKYQEVPAYTQAGEKGTTGSAVMVKVIPVRNGTAEQFVGLLRPLLPLSSEISAYTPNNALIISSTGSKINEIEKIIHSLDTPAQGTIEVIPLHYASANDIAASVKSMMPAASNSPGKTPIMIAADNNSNSILISGASQDRTNIKTLIKKMDTLTYDATKVSNTVVVNLRYLNAKDFAPILQNVASGESGGISVSSSVTDGSGKKSDGTGGSGSDALTAIRGLYAATDAGKSSSAATTSSYASAGGAGNSSGIHIQAEPATNSLIIDGSAAQIRSLKAVIAKLDVQPQQVLVEALIAEVDESAMQQLGIQWGTIPPSNAQFSGLTPGSAGSATGSNTSAGGNVPVFDNGFSAVTGGLGVGIVEVGRIKTLITALRNNAATNILSTPSLVVLDNEEAEIKVGQKASFNVGSYQNIAGGGGIVNQTETQDVALQLKVTPQISQNDTIRLKLEHQNDVLTSQTQNGNPIVNDSQFKTNVLINSGQILVIGGLISNDTEESVQKVPLLGNIPVLGRLFQYRNDSVTKKNLLIFLRPIILHNQSKANKETLLRYSMIRHLQLDRQRNGDILLPKGADAALPQWPYAPLPEPFSAAGT